MGFIQKIKDLLGLTEIEKRSAELSAQNLQLLELANKLKEAAAQVTPVTTQQQSSSDVDDLKLQLDESRKQIEGLQLLLSQSKEQAVKEYLTAAKEVVKKASEPGSVGRPALPGTKINLKIEEHLYEKICFLKESVPGFKVTPFINAAISKSLATFYDDHPELLGVLQQHVDEETNTPS